MSKGLFWEEPTREVAPRTPKVVREHEVLRVAVGVRGTEPIEAANAARKEVLAWVTNRSGGSLPEAAWAYDGFEHFSGGRNCIGIRLRSDQCDIWAIRADDPDKTVPDRIWTTEIVVGRMGSRPPRLSARLLASTAEKELVIEPHTQGFIQQIARTIAVKTRTTEETRERVIRLECNGVLLIDRESLTTVTCQNGHHQGRVVLGCQGRPRRRGLSQSEPGYGCRTYYSHLTGRDKEAETGI